MANTIPLTSMSYVDGIITANFSLAAGETLSLWGFTSNRPPYLVVATPQTCDNSFACDSYVVPNLPGDYNFDGRRALAADYVVWRKSDGTQAGFNLCVPISACLSSAGSGAGPLMTSQEHLRPRCRSQCQWCCWPSGA